MSNDYQVTLSCMLKPGVLRDHLAAALQPLTEYYRLSLADLVSLGLNPEVEQYIRLPDLKHGGELTLAIHARADASVISRLRKAGQCLVPLITGAGYAMACNHDAVDPDDAYTPIWFGEPAAVACLLRKEAVAAALQTLQTHFSQETVDQVKQLLAAA